jgi:hypothetical protein
MRGQREHLPGWGDPGSASQLDRKSRGEIMIIGKCRLVSPAFLGLCLVALSACAPNSTVATREAQIPAIAPGMARVWFMRDTDPQEQQGTPIIYVNGQPVGRSEPGTAFFRDFPPGAYGFKVQSYGIPTGYKDKLKLAPGMQVYLEVQWGGSWLEGVAGGEAFYVRTLSPELGQAYLRTMRYLGPTRAAS